MAEIHAVRLIVNFVFGKAFSLDGSLPECYKLRAYTYMMVAEAAKHFNFIKKAAVRNTSHEGVYP
ncbi:hypothetical protein DSCW_27420 [Desulfosarcina widdelii]|uniref:Uncharacterized protein n=1 Tax=Desulfosarcina widdelii TaxID=947919 RepID=A0A5K7Z3N0_9BACT|nr:hypothetical protein DSCW_27420 [Desulfosarcina widdelii]